MSAETGSMANLQKFHEERERERAVGVHETKVATGMESGVSVGVSAARNGAG